MLQIIELLSKVNSQVLKVTVPMVKKEGISFTEMLILWRVFKKGTYRATDLAKDAGIPPSTITGIIDRLVARDLILRINDSEDRRSVLVQGTPKLNEVMDRILSASDEKLSEIFKAIPGDFIDRIINDLQELHKYLLMDNQTRCDEGGRCTNIEDGKNRK